MPSIGKRLSCRFLLGTALAGSPAPHGFVAMWKDPEKLAAQEFDREATRPSPASPMGLPMRLMAVARSGICCL
jgi:hypothetical protein